MILVTYSSELSHHGILGQKWGKKNGPPYPLDPSDHSASEKKAGWTKSLDKKPSEKNQNDGKKVAKAIGYTAGAAAVLAGAAYYAKHRDEVNAFIKTAGSELKYNWKTSPKINAGKQWIKDLGRETKTGIKEGIKEIPKKTGEGFKEGISSGANKSAKIVGAGLMMLGAKEVVDIVAGKKKSEQIYKSQNNKKVDSFWKVYDENLNNNKKRSEDDD